MHHSLILVVEDNMDILKNLKITLESSNYNVITALGAEKALKELSTMDKVPDLILSDIMMPVIDGYEFFLKISSNPTWNSIPFIFLSAKSSPDDVRLGKLLGADDYITKPFQMEDLLAVIKGKIRRNEHAKLINNELNKSSILTSLKKASKSEPKKLDILLFIVYWDEEYGPTLKDYCPKDVIDKPTIEKISEEVFNSSRLIFNDNTKLKGETILLDMHYLKKRGYLFFDSYPDDTKNAKEFPYMIGVISPSITYLQSLSIKKVLNNLSMCVKREEKNNISYFWQNIVNILLE